MTIANPVTRLPFGITNVALDNLFADLRMSDPTLYHTYYNDFDVYTAADWTVTATGSTTQALTAGNGGLLLLTNSASDNDLLALQKNPAAWDFTLGRKTFFRTRFKVSDATQIDMVMGLQVVDTTPLDVTDGIYFLKADDATTVDIVCRKDATTGSVKASAITSLVSDTYIELGWYYDGVSKLTYEVNRVVVGALDVTNYLPDTTCTISFAIQNGDANARTMTLDYIFVARERVGS